MRRLLVLTFALFLLVPPGRALAHGIGESQDLPLPLWLYLFGAGAVVMASFVPVSLLVNKQSPPRGYPRIDLFRIGLLRAILANRALLISLRLLSVALFVLVVLSGLLGSQQTGDNFAPTFVWISWWVGFSFFTAFVGNLWPLMNPWKVIFEWADALARWLGVKNGLELREPYPVAWGVWPALVLFAGFVWVELVFENSSTPSKVALLALLYSIPTWSGMAVFGKEVWLRRGEAFSVFFSILTKFAPTEVQVRRSKTCQDCSTDCRTGEGGCVNCYECFVRATPKDRELNLRPWAVGLGLSERTSLSQLVFIVFVLASVTYDSLLPTQLWARLEKFTSMPETIGIFAVPLTFLTVYVAFVKLGQIVGGRRVPFGRLAAAYVNSLVPIAIAYQLAHYFTFLLVQGQAIIALISDPFGWGWDLFGTAGYEIDYALFDAGSIWYSQVALIVAGHLIAVYLSHVASLHLLRRPRLAVWGQLPVLAPMILYTVFSLWILSQPIVVAPSEEQKPALTVELKDARGNRVGTAEFSEDSTGVVIAINLRKGQRGIEPGEHGVHIHEKGEVTPNFGAAGGHFNPTNVQHGFENPRGLHAGDLGNILVLEGGMQVTRPQATG